MAVFKRQAVLLGSMLISGDLCGTETVREAVMSSDGASCQVEVWNLASSVCPCPCLLRFHIS